MHTTFVQYTHEQHSILTLLCLRPSESGTLYPIDVRNCDYIISFKRKLNSDINVVPKYFYTCNRKALVLHVRIRTKCSSLNNDLYQKGISESPLCLCGHIENAHHFRMKCHNYQAQRVELIHAVSQHTSVKLQTLLFGSDSLPMNLTSKFLKLCKHILLTPNTFNTHLSHRSIVTKSRKDVTRFQIRATSLLIYNHFFSFF